MRHSDDLTHRFLSASADKLVTVCADVDAVSGCLAEEFYVMDDFGMFFIFVYEWR
jgi:hypothetical protein